MTTPLWREMVESDLPTIWQIASICHPSFPETDSVLSEKFYLSPCTCLVLSTDRGKPVGYLLAHPYRLQNVPPLNRLLTAIPDDADALFIHDLALLPDFRCRGLARKAVSIVKKRAAKASFKNLSLIAVNGSTGFWEKQGFRVVEPSVALAEKLQAYSDDAVYMVKPN